MQTNYTGKTKEYSDNTSTLLIILHCIATAVLPMILAIAISQILSLLQIGIFFTIIKVLIYLIMIPCYLGTGIAMGSRVSGRIVDRHSGIFETSDRRLLTVMGIILLSLIIFTVINCFTIWAPEPLAGRIDRIYDMLGSLESTGLKLTLFMSVLYWGLFALMLLFTNPGDRCPRCGRYRVTAEKVLIDSKFGPLKYITEFGDTKTKVDVHDFAGNVSADIHSKTPVRTYESQTYSKTYKHVCKYCGYDFNTVDKGRTKNLVSEEVMKNKENINYRIH